MNIIYHQNPLKSKVELSESEIEVLKLKIKLEEVYNNIFDASYKVESINEIKLSLENIINSEEDPDSKINKRVELVLGYYVDELTLGFIHSGDCTKVCCSCTKCNAEDALGINTLQGLKGLHYISGAYPTVDTTIDEAIKNLSEEPIYDQEWHKPNIERWNKERALALASLIEYKEKHFPDSEESKTK